MGKSFPFLNVGRPWRVVLTLFMLLLGVAVRHHFSRMDSRFFQPSFSGAKGLLLYELGDLSGAARAYRADLREMYQTERTAADPAWNALLREDLESAEAFSNQTLESDPADTGALLTLGEIALERGNFTEALRRFDAVLQKETDQFDALLLSSIVHARSGDYVTPVRLLNRALRHNRAGSRITSFLAALKTTGELDDLPEAARPFCLLAHYHRYLRIFDPSNGRVAIRYAEKAITSGDQADDAYLTMGIVSDKQRRSEKALLFFLKAIEINPKNAEAHRRAGAVYSDRGDLLNEYRMVKRAYELDDDPFYLSRLNYFLTKKAGDYHQALALSERALEAKPDDVKAVHWVAYLHGFVGNQERAIGYYEKARLLEPENPVFYQEIGASLAELGREKEAIDAYSKSISIDPARPEPHFGLALLYRDQRRPSEAVKEYEQAFRFTEGTSHLRANLCILYYQVSAFEKAAECFKRVLSLDPGNKTAQRLLPYILSNVREASRQ